MRYRLSSAVSFSALVLMWATPSVAQSSVGTIEQKKVVKGSSETALQKRITVDLKDVPLRAALAEIDRQAGGLRLSYSPAAIPLSKRVSVQVKNAPAYDALVAVLRGTEVRIERGPEGQVLLLNSRKSDSTSTISTTGVIKGAVIDSATQEGVSGVTVTVTGTALSAVTREQGVFRIANVPVGEHSLSVKMLGYQTRTVKGVVDSGRTMEITITLRQTTTALAEVVTTATGQQKRVEIANDIARIDPDVIMRRTPVRSMTDLLAAAQVPGVLITPTSGNPGAPARIRIRGIGSISQSNDPVVIVDGVWIDAIGGTPSRLDDIDPSTIETLEIVRGPSAATLYGQDASNGVIVITTKRGQAGPTRWNASFNRDWGEVPGNKPATYVGYGHELNSTRARECDIDDVLSYFCIQDSVGIRDPNHPLLVDEGSAQVDRFTFSVDGGSKSVRYALNAALQNELGARRTPFGELVRLRLLNYPIKQEFAEPSHLTRRNLAANFTMSPTQELDLTLTLSGNQNELRDNRYNNQYSGIPSSVQNLDTIEFLNKEVEIVESESRQRSLSGVMSVQAAWRPKAWWNVNAQTGLERVSSEASGSEFGPRCIDQVCLEVPGYRDETQQNANVYTVRFQTSARPSLGGLDRFLEIRPAFGADLRKNETVAMAVARLGIPAGERTLGGGTIYKADYTQDASATAGWYLNATIGIWRRMYFDVGLRQDIGSAITSTSDAKYPKLGTSWLISDESFWPQNNLVRTLRLRGAFGHAAVQPEVGDIRGKYVTGQVYVADRLLPSANQVSVGNPRLNPERATEFEFGFDADVLQDRVQLTVTGVHKENRNTLVERAIAPSAGVNSTRKENVARVVNRGLELSMTARAIERRNLLLVVNYNLSIFDNQVARLGNDVTPFSPTGFIANRIAEGYPIGGIWSRSILGYQDQNGDGLLAGDEMILGDSLVYIGWTQPRRRANYGITLTAFNTLTFDSRFSYQGNYIQTVGQYNGEGSVNIHAPLAEQAIARVSQLSRGRPISDVRWNSASISYQLPLPVLQRIHARTLSVSLQGSNLGLWTTYRGRDPAVNSSTYSEGLSDSGNIIPQPRKYVLAIRWGF